MFQTISRTKLGSTLCPIVEELDMVQTELKNLASGLGFSFFVNGNSMNMPDDLLHASLLLLSAKSAASNISKEDNSRLIQLASIMEFIHYAVFSHNKIIENNAKPSNPSSINNSLAVLLGDILYTKAFSLASTSFDKYFSSEISVLTQNMCIAEIKEEIRRSTKYNQDKYIQISWEKTAVFFGACCKLGVGQVSTKKSRIIDFEHFGLNFGMVYQMALDRMNNHPAFSDHTITDKFNTFASKAKDSIDFSEDSIYKDSLLELLNLYSSNTDKTAENTCLL